MCAHPALFAVEDRSNAQVALEVFKGSLNFGQHQVKLPELCALLLGEIAP